MVWFINLISIVLFLSCFRSVVERFQQGTTYTCFSSKFWHWFVQYLQQMCRKLCLKWSCTFRFYWHLCLLPLSCFVFSVLSLRCSKLKTVRKACTICNFLVLAFIWKSNFFPSLKPNWNCFDKNVANLGDNTVT